MPTFTAREAEHPNRCVGKCFAIDIHVSDDPGETQESYLSDDFGRCMISDFLAIELGLKISKGAAEGNIQIESRPEIGEDGPVVHRSQPLFFKFSTTNKYGPRYIHFSANVLSELFELTSHIPGHGFDNPFLVLKPDLDALALNEFCQILPIQL
jgi:hypothetical protein